LGTPWICPSNSGKPKQYTGCPNGMDCTFLHEHDIMGCVDKNYDSTEDIRAHFVPYMEVMVNHALNKNFASK
jgi:hypothetical protein